MTRNYDLLIEKLDRFIRKYYLNRLLRGAILTAAVGLALFILINLLEYYLFLPSAGRWTLVSLFMGITGFLFFRFVITDLIHFFKLGRVISHQQAAAIIGSHFSNVSDKLLNILQLKEGLGNKNEELVLASIEQKTEEIKLVPFQAAIDLNQNKKYLKYLIPPALVLLFIVVAAPNIIRDGSKRLARPHVYFEKDAPFRFLVKNEKLKSVQGQDFLLEISVEGEILPDEVYIRYDGQSVRARKISNSQFEYLIRNLQKSLEFQLFSGDFSSKMFVLDVIPKPVISGFKTNIKYPDYTGKKEEALNNIGDLVVPLGSELDWSFSTQNTRSIDLKFGDTILSAIPRSKEIFSVKKTAVESGSYLVVISGTELPQADSVLFSLTVIPDNFPTITVNDFRDTVLNKQFYFEGEAMDDYGVRSVYFKYKIEGKDKSGDFTSLAISTRGNQRFKSFTHYWDLVPLGVSPGDEVSWFFEVWDNDGINGSKSSRTPLRVFKLPGVEELDNKVDETNQKIKEELLAALKDAQKLKDDVKEIQEKLIDKSELDWQDKKAIEDLAKKQKDLQNQIETAQNKYQQNLKQQQDYKSQSEEILQKQNKLQELFEQLLNDEMKELFQKLESMLDEFRREDMMKKMEDFEMTNEELEKELDKMLSLFKEMEFEQKMKETISKMEQLAKEQNELSQQTEQKSLSDDELQKKQDELKDRLEQLTKSMDDLKDLRDELDKNINLEQFDQATQDTKDHMDQGNKELSKGQNKKASQQQKKAADKIQEMAEQMAGMMQEMQMEEMEEDMESIRRLLKNLVTLSFEQEDLFQTIGKMSTQSPSYPGKVQAQNKLSEDFRVIEDSLFALSKRVFQIQTFVNDEVGKIKRNFKSSTELLHDRNVRRAIVDQQLIMTGLNNLALMLSEVLEQMQQQMASQMSGQQMCQSKGNKPGASPKMSDLQKQLNDKITEMQNKKGEGGQNPGKGNQGMSKEFAEMAARQAALREALQKLQQEEGKDGKGTLGNLDQVIEEMDKTETELVNKQLTNEMLKRQQEIFTRLLEAEDALRQREEDEKRESNVGRHVQRDVPPTLEEYIRKRESEVEFFKTMPPGLQPHYRTLVEKYFRNLSF